MEKIAKKTIQIQAKGAVRLSTDLVPDATHFKYAIDKRKKKITLLPLSGKEQPNGNCVRVWKSNARAATAMFAAAKLLRQVGVDWETNIHQTYKVKRRGDTLEIQL